MVGVEVYVEVGAGVYVSVMVVAWWECEGQRRGVEVWADGLGHQRGGSSVGDGCAVAAWRWLGGGTWGWRWHPRRGPPCRVRVLRFQEVFV